MQAEQSIVVDPRSPGGINSPHALIPFDGVCVLCSRGCRFVNKHDRSGYFRFVPIQLAEGRPLAEQLGARAKLRVGGVLGDEALDDPARDPRREERLAGRHDADRLGENFALEA